MRLQAVGRMEELKGYGWVDRKAGIVRIPDRAKRMDPSVADTRPSRKGKGPRTEVELNSRKSEPDQKDSNKKSQP